MSESKKSVSALLSSAIGTGEVISIIYHGGSHPGSVRDMLPLNLYEDKVWALCVHTNTKKSFKLSRIELIEE